MNTRCVHISLDGALKEKTKVSSQKKKLSLKEVLQFIGLSTSIFLILFVGMNAPAFASIAQSSFFPEIQKQKEVSFHQVLQSKESSSSKLLTINAPQKKKSYEALSIPIAPLDARLVIPKIGKNVPIAALQRSHLEGTNWHDLEKHIQKSLENGIVLYPGTANPGEVGNVFLTGHSSYYPWADGRYKDVFAMLGQLEVGDEYFIYSHQKKYTYRIREKKEVKPTNIEVLSQPKNEKISTLMTCWPVGTTLRRLILVAEEV